MNPAAGKHTSENARYKGIRRPIEPRIAATTPMKNAIPALT